jgi:hypothetical protein
VVTVATQAVLTASYAGVSLTASLTVNPPANLASISLNPNTLSAGQTAMGTVTVSAPAGSGGIVVSLSNSNSSVATVPASVTIPQGATSGTFTATALNLSKGNFTTITASYNGVQKTERLNVRRYFVKD